MNFYTRKRRMPAVIIVSLIDIFAILLIFVIVTTTFKRAQPAVIIKLPESATAAADVPSKDALAVLSISPKGEIFVDKQAVPVEGLAQTLKEVVSKGRSIALNADTNAPFGVVVRVLDALKEAGVKGNLPAFTERKGN